ncbi:hypothetical protein H7R52_03120 [Weissella confusa]|uniref:Uncharacterized protein n=1 Tax=Weissella confusa TaxID=1583 RepID=A0A923SNW8_WEICO|nr:hypothetical protein [Weissella confusa]
MLKQQILDVEKRVYHSTNGEVVTTYYVSAMSKINEIDFEFVPSNNLILNLQWFGDGVNLPLQTIAQNWRNYSRQTPHQTSYSLPNKQQMPLSNAEALTVVTEYANPIKFKSDVDEAGGVDLKRILEPVIGNIPNDLN